MQKDTEAQLDAIRAKLIKDQTTTIELQEIVDSNEDNITSLPVLRLSEREFRLIGNCIMYASSDPAGLPGHNLMLIVAKLAEHVDNLGGYDYTPDQRTAPMPTHGINQ